jgi:hypothetical protein
MSKYCKKKVNQICDLIRKDSYTIVELCLLSGISKDTYYDWLRTKSDFSDKIEAAHRDYDELIVKEAKKSLLKKVTGYTVQEKRTVYEDSGKKDSSGKLTPRIKEQTIIDKHIQPDTPSIILVLTNKVPGEYKNRQNNEITGKDGKDFFARLTDEELDAKIAELNKKNKK